MEWIPVGKIGKPHGLKGELKFHPFVDEEMLNAIERLRLKGKGGGYRELRLERLRGTATRLIAQFAGMSRIEDVEPLVGAEVEACREDFPSLPEGEYYWFEVEGLRVYDEEDRYFGKVMEIIRTGSNDVYVVRDGSKELLLPMIDSVVKKIDLEEGKLVFHPIEGLLEDTSV